MLRRASPSEFLHPKSRHLLIAHASFLTRFVPVWQMDLATLEVLFFFVTVQEFGVLRQSHAFLPPVLFSMQVAPEADHLRVQKQQCDLG